MFAALLLFSHSAPALDRTNVTFKIFRFPPNMIPTIDGKTNDWDIVPEDYAVGMDQLVDDTREFPGAGQNSSQGDKH